MPPQSLLSPVLAPPPAGPGTPSAGAAPGRPAGPAHTGAIRLATGEAVEFEVRVARLGSRALALLIDIVVELSLLWAMVFAGAFMLAVLNRYGVVDEALIAVLITVAVTLAVVGYPVTMETLTRGRTVGKFAVGLRTVRDDGGPVRFRHALTRALVGVAVEWPGLLLPPVGWVAGLWTMLVNPAGKRLGDFAAGTMVIHERSPDTWGWVPAMPPALIGWAHTLDLTGLRDDLALDVRHFLARNRRMAEPARTALGYSLAAEVAAVVTPPAPPGTPGWAYLAAVLAERNRRAAARLVRDRATTATVWPELAMAVQPVSHQLAPRGGRRQQVGWRA
jgi:uncharacterized RDD family membrane protein YckC